MRFVDRAEVNEPQSLENPSAPVLAEKIAAEAFYRTYDPLAPKAKGYKFIEYKGFDVASQLRNLFHNKCAYCESDLGDTLEVEHFRPKGGVTEDPAHAGYWWLAHSWNNLLPSCVPCNQKRRQHIVTEEMTSVELTRLMANKAKVSYGKANHFPIAGVRAVSDVCSLNDEKPQLIDPTVDDPYAYLKWTTTSYYSLVLAKPTDLDEYARARNTITIFALNRARLVQSRTRVLAELRFQAEEILAELEQDMIKGGSPDNISRALRRAHEMRRHHAPQQPYSAMAKAFVEEFSEELRQRIAT